ncbi:hypothetical protein NFX46_13930 [Streptomyces phaeoluteigriseus]|uniref:Uncharacterized protein n=1 Tax=Streptomyces phaeoluteigriseus TaxID=114686 RepID=A0ABY4Z6W7_9ACTN|nr:hypothetical protein [Streptomyces phaeoluteigriseus]USQ84794.1 hypothetical protein NFX46_13930 [Streptomyces phaeoluteigriseus]
MLHRDSTGSLRTIRPREAGLMTSGRAISHCEESPRSTPAPCTAPSSGSRCPTPTGTPSRTSSTTPRRPRSRPCLTATVILGDLDGATSPARRTSRSSVPTSRSPGAPTSGCRSSRASSTASWRCPAKRGWTA